MARQYDDSDIDWEIGRKIGDVRSELKEVRREFKEGFEFLNEKIGEQQQQIDELPSVVESKSPASTDLQSRVAELFAKTAGPVIEKQNHAIGVMGDTVTELAREVQAKNSMIDRLSQEIAGLRQSVTASAAELPAYLQSAPEIKKFVADIDSKIKGLEHAAFSDPLTGLNNRAGMDRIFSQSRGVVMAMMFDVDKFKGINDRYGHTVGDAVLKGVAREIEQSARELYGADRVHCIRVSGDEFAVLVACRTEGRNGEAFSARSEIEHFIGSANAIKNRVASLRFKDDEGSWFGTTVSIGIGSEVLSLPSSDRSVSRLGDAEMYFSKEHGRDRVSCNTAKLTASLDKALGGKKQDQGIVQAAGFGGPKPGR